MKKFALSLLFCLLAINSFARMGGPVVMVSYEQSWLDYQGTLAIRNQTNETIHNVSFRITYLDMKDVPLDYEDFTYNIEIAPGMTKKLDIPAYEHDRHYNYYKSEGTYGGTAFKINFKFKEYNTAKSGGEGCPDDGEPPFGKRDTNGDGSMLAVLFLLVFMGVVAGLFVLVSLIAQRNNRNPILWVLLSFVAGPIIVIIILLCIGKDKNDEFIEDIR